MPAARLASALFGLCSLWLADPAAAQAVQPQPPLSQSPQAAPIHLSYVILSHGFRVVTVEVTLTLAPGGYAISAHNQTSGMVDMLFHSDVTSVASGRFDGSRAVPTDYASSGNSRGANRITRIAYVNGMPEVRQLTPVDPDRDPVPAAATDHSVDSLSAMVELMHTVQTTGGCDGTTRIFDGSRLSTMTARTIGPQPMPPAEVDTPYGDTALRCDLTGLQLAGFLHDEDEAKMRLPQNGIVWLRTVLPDAPPLPVRVSFTHPHVGVLTAMLVGAHR